MTKAFAELRGLPPARRRSVRRLGEASQPVAGGTDVRGQSEAWPGVSPGRRPPESAQLCTAIGPLLQEELIQVGDYATARTHQIDTISVVVEVDMPVPEVVL